MAVIGSGSSGRGGAPGGGTIIIRGTWKLTQEKNGLGERTNRRTKKGKKSKEKPSPGPAGSGLEECDCPEARSPGRVLRSQGRRGTGQVTPGGNKPRDPAGPCGQEPSSDQETGEGKEAGSTGAPEESSGPSIATMSLSPWPIRVPRVRVV